MVVAACTCATSSLALIGYCIPQMGAAQRHESNQLFKFVAGLTNAVRLQDEWRVFGEPIVPACTCGAQNVVQRDINILWLLVNTLEGILERVAASKPRRRAKTSRRFRQQLFVFAPFRLLYAFVQKTICRVHVAAVNHPNTAQAHTKGVCWRVASWHTWYEAATSASGKTDAAAGTGGPRRCRLT